MAKKTHEERAFTYEECDIDHIIEWCQKNNQVEWLKKKVEEKITVEKYSERKKKLDEDGKPILNKRGNPIYVVDKSSKKVTEERKIDFMTVKTDFYEKFKDQLPANFKKEPTKKKAPTMYDKIAAL